MRITVSGRVIAKSYSEAYESMIETLNKQRYHIVDNVSLCSHSKIRNGRDVFIIDWDYEADVVSV